MDATAAREQILDRALAIDDDQFEQLCKMVIERGEQTRDLELTPFRGDGGIDVHAVIDRDLFHARLGVQTKQYRPGNTVGVRTLRSFKGALSDQAYHIGTVITTSAFTTGAVESAERDYIRLINGDQLATVMVEGGIGVTGASDQGYSIDESFWAAFEKPEDSDTIPSIEVPQADNFNVLRHVLRAVDSGNDIKPAITAALEAATGEDWASRQADYYGIAGWLLGFLHKEQRVQIDHQEVRRWGLTRDGEEYLALLDRGDRQTATARLHEAIRTVEIVSRIYAVIEAEGELDRETIAELIEAESAVSGSTAPRRAQTVGQWLAELPEIRVTGRGDGQTFAYRGGP